MSGHHQGVTSMEIIWCHDKYSGIGFEACRIFTQMNPEKLVIAARSESRGAQASKLIAGTPGAKCTPDVWPLDLTSLTSVEAFAKRCISELRRLDVLVSWH